jgi:hypothetical protein
MTYSVKLQECSLNSATPFSCMGMQAHHVGVTTMEKLDKGHLHPLEERRENK